MKTKTIANWITTALAAIAIEGGGVAQMMAAAKGTAHVPGYPPFLLNVLGAHC
jgi:hypothetical protein